MTSISLVDEKSITPLFQGPGSGSWRIMRCFYMAVWVIVDYDNIERVFRPDKIEKAKH